MDLSKLRTGELVAAIGGIVLLLSLLFLPWYEIPGVPGSGANLGAWDGQGFLGTLANLVILAAGVVAVGLAVVTATSRTVAIPVATSALTAGSGLAAVLMIILRILFQPDAEVSGFGLRVSVDTSLDFGIFFALAGAVTVAWGGWKAMQDEGTTSFDRRDRLQPPPPRPSAPAPPSAPSQPSAPGAPPGGAPPPGGPPGGQP